MKKLPACVCVVLVLAAAIAHARPLTDLAKSPPMGWNSWNWHGKNDINEKVVEQTIDAMVTQGLRDAGYTHVVVDGGWRDVKLGTKGELLSHPTKFPGGMKRLADYAHARGLKFGLHTVPGTHDCGGNAVGGFDHEELHLKQFLEWGLDFVKLELRGPEAQRRQGSLRCRLVSRIRPALRGCLPEARGKKIAASVD